LEEGRNDFKLLLYLTTKHAFETLGWVIAQLPPWLRICLQVCGETFTTNTETYVLVYLLCRNVRKNRKDSGKMPPIYSA